MHTFHGTIISCDPSDSVHSYLVEEGGRILFVGDTLPEAYGRASVTELGRRVLIPAFADTHMHFSSLALFQGGVNVSPFRSNSEILEYLSTLHEDSREEVVIGFGLSPFGTRGTDGESL